jgi:hypothetical protein
MQIRIRSAVERDSNAAGRSIRACRRRVSTRAHRHVTILPPRVSALTCSMRRPSCGIRNSQAERDLPVTSGCGARHRDDERDGSNGWECVRSVVVSFSVARRVGVRVFQLPALARSAARQLSKSDVFALSRPIAVDHQRTHTGSTAPVPEMIGTAGHNVRPRWCSGRGVFSPPLQPRLAWSARFHPSKF